MVLEGKAGQSDGDRLRKITLTTLFAVASGVGRGIQAFRALKKIGSPAAESGAVRTLTAAEKKLYGPVTRSAGFKEKVWDMNKGPDGLVRDPSGKVMKFVEPWELGHVPGHKAADMRVWAAEQKMDRATWIKVQNDPYIYRPELPRTNSGHLWEFTW
jgi:hypothetical protein